MVKPLLKILFRHSFEQTHETHMQHINKNQRAIDGQKRVGQARPRSLVVSLDRGTILSESELETNKGIGVAVCDVMHHLANGPAAVAIGDVELSFIEARDRGPKALGQQAQSFN